MDTRRAVNTEEKRDVYIFANGLEKDMLRQIMAGIEDEGALYEILYIDDENAAPYASALKDAHSDPGAELRRVSGGGTLLAIYNGSKKDFRVLGANAVRYVSNRPIRLE